MVDSNQDRSLEEIADDHLLDSSTAQGNPSSHGNQSVQGDELTNGVHDAQSVQSVQSVHTVYQSYGIDGAPDTDYAYGALDTTSVNSSVSSVSSGNLAQLTSEDTADVVPQHCTRESSAIIARNHLTCSDVFFWCVLPIIVVLLLRIFVVGFYIIPSGSMKNTIAIGDRVITTKINITVDTLQRGDIIVFKDPAHWLSKETSAIGDDLIKRLIGLPGDTVSCAGPGSPILVNGVAIDESAYVPAGVNPSDFAFSITVSEGNVFVLGDNRANSADSRYHATDGNNGLVPIVDIKGIAKLTYWPLTHLHFLDAHHEVFADVPNSSS